MKDFPGHTGEVSAYGPGVVTTTMVQEGDGRRDIISLAKAPHVQVIEGKVGTTKDQQLCCFIILFT